MTNTNPNVASSPVLTSALQAALQGKTDLFSMIDGGKGFSALLQQLDVDQADAAQAQVKVKSERAQAGDDQMSSDANAAPCRRETGAESRAADKADQSRKSAARNNDDTRSGNQDATRETTCIREQDATASSIKEDAADEPEITLLEAADTTQLEVKTGDVLDVPCVQVKDVVAPQAHVPEPTGQHVLPQQAQHAVQELTGEEETGGAACDLPAQAGAETVVPQATTDSASGDGHSAGRRNQMQAAIANDETGLQDTTSVGGALGDQVPQAKPEATLKQEAVDESPKVPVAHDHNKPAGGTSPTLTAFVAAPKPVEAPASGAAQHAGNAAKIDSAGLRLYETAGKLTQGYDQTTQLTAPKSAKSTVINATQVIEQVTVRLNQQAKSGLDQMTIQLRPADLGRVDIRLNFQDGAVTALVTADSQTTLDILAKDSRSLERALQDAGLRADSSSLSFQLRDPGGRGAPQDDRGAGGGNNYNFEASEALLAEAESDGDIAIIEPNRVNLRV